MSGRNEASSNERPRGGRFVAQLVLVLLAMIAVLPFLWLICATFKTDGDIFQYSFLPWDNPGRLTLDNYRRLFGQAEGVLKHTLQHTLQNTLHSPFPRWLLNSLFLSSLYTVLVVTISSLGGFALAKYRFRGKSVFMLLMLATMLIPAQVLLPSSYELIYRLGWIDSYAAIVIPGAASVFGVFLFRQAMLGVPDELLAAARIDGCGELRIWWEVALPMVRPMTGAFTLLSFLGAWNGFLWPQIVLQSKSKYTLPIGLASMVGIQSYQTPYGVLMAATLLSILPAALLFLLLQKEFVAGMASGAMRA